MPWWRPWPGAREPEETATFAGRTDAAGVHRVRVDFEPQAKPRPRQIVADATVMDVNRQAWAARVPLLVHPALDYVGLRAERPFVRKGESLAVDVIVTDLDGRAVRGRRAALRAERLDWEQVEGEWKEVPKDTQERSVDSGPDPQRVLFEAREGGSWRVVARVLDEAGRANETEMPLWVAGGRVPPRRDLEEEAVTIVPDRREYRPGDVARLLVVAPFAPAEALVTLRRAGLVREQRLRIEEASREIEVKVEEGFTPNVHVHVALVGAAARDASSPGTPARPAFASGEVDLPVPPGARTLSVEVKPRDAALAPGGETVVDLALRDAAGRPAANGEATVVVVDEAVLALTGYERPDPLAVFYARRDEGVSDYRLRRDVLLASPEDLARRMVGGAGGARASRRWPWRPRSRRRCRRRRQRRRRRALEDGRGRGEGSRADPRAHRLRRARPLRGDGADRRGRPRTRAAEAARQPHALPRDGRRRRRRARSSARPRRRSSPACR